MSEHFYHRFLAFMKVVILDDNGPLSEVNHYFWRLEYQHRGALHIHMKLYCENASVFNKDSSSDVQKFIETKITCNLPFQFQSCSYVRLLIIDEISMVNNLQLAFIHQRLQEIFGDSRKIFFHLSIVTFSDLFVIFG